MANEVYHDLLLQVTDLKQWAYCPRVVYYRYCLPTVRPVTFSMSAGIRAHEDAVALEERRSLRAYGLTSGERHFDVAVRSARLGLSARIDLVIRTETPQGPAAIVVDYKLSERDAGTHFKLQLAAYALLIEEAWDMPVTGAFIYHIPLRQAEAVALTPALRHKVAMTTCTIKAAILGESMPSPPASLARCVACEFRRFCNDVV